MLISYRKADPSGNITGLVESPVEISLRPLVTQRVLSACPDMEQLGFVSPCGAAALAGRSTRRSKMRSAAWVF